MLYASMLFLTALIHDLIYSYELIFIFINHLDSSESAEPCFIWSCPICHPYNVTCKHEFRKNNFICLSILESSISCCVLHGTAGVDCLISVTLNFHHLSIRYAGKCWEAGILKIISTEFFWDSWSKLFESISLLLHGFSLSIWAMSPWVRKIEFLVPYLKLLYNCLTL